MMEDLKRQLLEAKIKIKQLEQEKKELAIDLYEKSRQLVEIDERFPGITRILDVVGWGYKEEVPECEHDWVRQVGYDFKKDAMEKQSFCKLCGQTKEWEY